MSCIFPLFHRRDRSRKCDIVGRAVATDFSNRAVGRRGAIRIVLGSIRLAKRIQTAKRYSMEIGFTERRHRTLLLRLTGDERHAKRSTDKQRETRTAEISLVKVLRHREIQRWARKGETKKGGNGEGTTKGEAKRDEKRGRQREREGGRERGRGMGMGTRSEGVGEPGVSRGGRDRYLYSKVKSTVRYATKQVWPLGIY